MDIKRHNPGARFSQAVVHNSTVYVAGQVGDGATVREQTESVLKKIDAVLAAVGSSKSRALSATVYLADMRTYDEMNQAWDAWIDPDNKPARATVEARLAATRYAVEISLVAAL
jgi:enamine deaminase RidA (YjgF/YER057c/UK114 family)